MPFKIKRRVFLSLLWPTIILLLGVGKAIWGQEPSTQKTATPNPSEFFIVTTWDDDFYPYWQTSITHALQRSDGVLLTYTYVQSATRPCNEPDIKSTERLLPSTRIETLTAPLNLCALDPERINASAKRYTSPPKPFETARTGVVTFCGTGQRVFKLPKFEINERVLEQYAPDALKLTRLEHQVLASAFGKEDLNQLVSKEAGANKLLDLATEKFKAGFWYCFSGVHSAIPAEIKTSASPTLGVNCDWLKFQNVLATYKHPAEGTQGRKARLIDSSGYRLLKYVAAEYPPIFVQRDVRGIVELELNVSQETGRVESVTTVSGPKYLSGIAEDAAKQWQFDPKQTIKNPVKSKVEFSVQCDGQ